MTQTINHCKTAITSTLLYLLLCHTCIAIGSAHQPAISHPNRLITFQAGKLGDKPWDPNASGTVSSHFASAVFTKPLYIRPDYTIKPGIFKNWQWDFKTNSFLFTINDNLFFDQTRPLHAKDVEYAFVKAFMSEMGFYFRRNLQDIVGIKNINSTSNFYSGVCKGIKVLSKNKLQVFLNSPNPNFLFALQDGLPFIAPIEDFKRDHFNFKSTPRGTGPYTIHWSSPKDSRVILKKRNISRKDIEASYPLYINFLNEGLPTDNKPDIAAGAGTSGLQNLDNWKILLGRIPMAQYSLDFNYKQELANNSKFREAISLAINRKELIKGYSSDKISYELIPFKFMGRAGLKNKQNIKKAKSIVNQYLKHISSPQKPLKAIFHGTPKKMKPIPKRLKKQLEKIGLYVQFTGTRILRQFGEDKDAIFKINGIQTSFTDPLACFSRFMPTQEGNLTSPTNNKNILKIFNYAKKAPTIKEKAKHLTLLSKEFSTQSYAIPIADMYPKFAMSKNINSIDIENIHMDLNFLSVKMKKKDEQ